MTNRPRLMLAMIAVTILSTWLLFGIAITLGANGRHSLAVRNCENLNRVRTDVAGLVDASVEDGYISEHSLLANRVTKLRTPRLCD